MASTASLLEGMIPSANDLQQLNPNWSDVMIEEFLTLFRNFVLLSNTADENAANAEQSDGLTMARVNQLQQQVGSGNPLTWDETGFTWDSTKLSFDQTEA